MRSLQVAVSIRVSPFACSLLHLTIKKLVFKVFELLKLAKTLVEDPAL